MMATINSLTRTIEFNGKRWPYNSTIADPVSGLYTWRIHYFSKTHLCVKERKTLIGLAMLVECLDENGCRPVKG